MVKSAAQSKLSPAGTRKRVGNYHLHHQLGRDALAETWLGTKVSDRTFQKLVVVRLFHSELAKVPAFRAGLKSEGTRALRVRHPKLAELYEVVTIGRDCFTVGEYVAGESLASVIERGTSEDPLGVCEVARIVADAADAVDAAHALRDSKGEPDELLHSCVDPSQIIVLYNGGVKVTGLGLGLALAGLTAAKKYPGPMGYGAPERAEGKPLARTADVYSLGVSLWEGLALRPVGKSYEPASKHRGEVTDELDEVCNRAMSVDPNARYASPRDMRVDIENFLWTANYQRDSDTIAAYMNETFVDEILEQQALVRRIMAGTVDSEEMLVAGNEDVDDDEDTGVRDPLDAAADVRIEEEEIADDVIDIDLDEDEDEDEEEATQVRDGTPAPARGAASSPSASAKKTLLGAPIKIPSILSPVGAGAKGASKPKKPTQTKPKKRRPTSGLPLPAPNATAENTALGASSKAPAKKSGPATGSAAKDSKPAASAKPDAKSPAAATPKATAARRDPTPPPLPVKIPRTASAPVGKKGVVAKTAAAKEADGSQSDTPTDDSTTPTGRRDATPLPLQAPAEAPVAAPPPIRPDATPPPMRPDATPPPMRPDATPPPMVLGATQTGPDRKKVYIAIGCIVLLVALIGIIVGSGDGDDEKKTTASNNQPAAAQAADASVAEVKPPAATPPDARADNTDNTDNGNGPKPGGDTTARPPKRPPPTAEQKRQRARKHYREGVRRFVEGNNRAAKTSFRAAIRLSPGYAPAHRGLGLVYERTKDPRTKRTLRKYLQLAPNARDAASIRARIKRLGGR